MRGFSFLEFLIAAHFCLLLLLTGYGMLDRQTNFLAKMSSWTRPEQESNYRLLLLRNLMQDSSQQLKRNAFLQNVPFFFPDLNFGVDQRKDAFSFARPLSGPVWFRREGTWYHVPKSSSLKAGGTVLLGGSDTGGHFEWNYARVLLVDQSGPTQKLKLKFILAHAEMDSGSLMQTEIHGFVWRSNTLYWVSPSGSLSPFFGPMEEFSYNLSGSQVTIFWRSAGIAAHFRSTL